MKYDHKIYLQQLGLKALDLYHGNIDGLDGPKTKAAWSLSVKAVKPSLDDVKRAFKESPRKGVAPSYRDREKFFGPVGEKGGHTPPLTFFPPPYPMEFSWGGKVKRLGVHSLIAGPLQAALGEIASLGKEFIKKYGLDKYAGCYNPRKSRGGSGMSDHAWAAAIDLNPAENGNRTLWPAKATMPIEAIEIFRKHGFQVGFKKGPDRRDMMHIAFIKRD